MVGAIIHRRDDHIGLFLIGGDVKGKSSGTVPLTDGVFHGALEGGVLNGDVQGGTGLDPAPAALVNGARVTLVFLLGGGRRSLIR